MTDKEEQMIFTKHIGALVKAKRAVEQKKEELQEVESILGTCEYSLATWCARNDKCYDCAFKKRGMRALVLCKLGLKCTYCGNNI